MSRKIVSILLVAGLLLGLLAACSNNKDSATSTPKPTATPAPAAATDQPEDSGEEVPEEDTDPFPGVDLGGVTINIKIGDDKNPDAENANEATKEKWSARKAEVEEKFNITLNLNAMQGVSWDDTASTIINSVAAGNPVFDIGDLSRYFMGDLVNNKAIVDVTDVVADYTIPRDYIAGGREWAGRVYGVAIAKDMTSSALVYNRDLILSVGMEKTPTEMFKEGKWSYDDFYDYIVELDSKLPDGVDAFGIHALSWARAAAHANGTGLYDPNTYIPIYTNEAFYESVDAMTKLVASGAMRGAVEVTRSDESIGYNWNSAQQGFEEQELAMIFGSDWSFENWQSKFDMGIVPFPWGSNVTIKNNDYTTLAESGYAASYHDCGFWPVTVGSEKKATPKQLFDILYSYLTENADQMLIDYEKEQNGEPIYDKDAGLPRNFTTELDIELWDWYRSTTVFEPFDSVAQISAPYWAIYDCTATNTSARSAMEAVIGKDTSALLQAGLIDANLLSADLKAEVEAYDASVVEEE